ncbi:MAG: nitrilase-related carbon-nitrogen hydrolase, partial [Longimicrobiales bacterium]
MPNAEPFRIAAVQAAPVFLDLEATLDKACGLIAEAARGGARLVAFPEAFVSGYPVWVWFVPSGRTHALRAHHPRLHPSAISIPGPPHDRLREAAASHGIAVTVGVNERNSEASDSTL